MRSFISGVLSQLLETQENISELSFILPSKRAGSFLLKELAQLSDKNLFAPKIYSIEDYAEEIAGLKSIDNTISLFEFYETYKSLTPEAEIEDFDTFTPWAQSLLHDFNEIDRYLIDADHFFSYLSRIQDLEHWSLQPEKTGLIENYLKFWNRLPEYYTALKDRLLAQQNAYQGLVYRTAAEAVETYANSLQHKHIFIGFNALNQAEQKIIQHLLQQEKALIFWDIDQVFIEDQKHGASLFIREYLKNWEYYRENSRPEFPKVYAEEKKIQITGVPKNIGQAKYLGEILSNYSEEELKNTAVILGEEELLVPVLNSLPPNVARLNITMGFPLKSTPLQSLFEKIFQLNLKSHSGYYYKDVIAILSHPALQAVLGKTSEEFIQNIHSENLVYLNKKSITAGFSEKLAGIISALFFQKELSISEILENFQFLIQEIKTVYKENNELLNLEILYRYHQLFNKLSNLQAAYPHIKSLKNLQRFFRELSATESLDFQGKPFTGLQLMGMLESRALDFKNVIITSLNEGVLPAGKSANSFIPYELKKEFGLPTYREKDAVYTNHFYRLLQRAKNVHLLYNTESAGLNAGERSRFITQLQVERQKEHSLIQNLVSPSVPALEKRLKRIEKTPEILQRLKSLAASGFSPSALSTYIRNPIDFYYQYVLGVRDEEEVEETVAANTLGTVIHDSLENFYKPLEGEILSLEQAQEFLKRVPREAEDQFKKTYSKGPMDKGKNLIIFEIAKRYLSNFLKLEIKRLQDGEQIKIQQIENNLKTALSVEKLDFPVYIRGKVDRVEISNGTTRIIDYKTGKVSQNQIEITDWQALCTDYDKYSKSFQVLTYASLIENTISFEGPVEAGIISFKNLRSGFLKFAKKDSPHQRTGKKTNIDAEILTAFQEELKNLIVEICDPNVAFEEKEIKEFYGTY